MSDAARTGKNQENPGAVPKPPIRTLSIPISTSPTSSFFGVLESGARVRIRNDFTAIFEQLPYTTFDIVFFSLQRTFFFTDPSLSNFCVWLNNISSRDEHCRASRKYLTRSILRTILSKWLTPQVVTRYIEIAEKVSTWLFVVCVISMWREYQSFVKLSAVSTSRLAHERSVSRV